MLTKPLRKFLTLSLIAMSSASYAITDWTLYLKSLQNSCDGGKLYDLVNQYNNTKKFPKSLQASIVKATPVNVFSDSEAQATFPSEGYELLLNDAIAFGYPITKIRIVVPETEYFDFTISFANTGFMQLIPKFFVTSSTGKKGYAGTQKLWVEYTQWSDNKQKYILKHYQTPPYASFNDDEFVDKIAKKASDKIDYHIYRTTKTGWDDSNDYMPRMLNFDKTSKTVTCVAGG